MIMINILLLQVIINKLIAEHFTVKLAQANLASKKDIAALVKKIDFHENVSSNKNDLNELSKKFGAISAKRLTKDLINKFSILNGAKYFSSGKSSQILSVYIS